MRAGSKEQHAAWVQSRISKIPDAWQPRYIDHYNAKKKDEVADSVANAWLREETADFENIKLPLTATDDQLCDIANQCAAHCMDLYRVSTDLATLRANQEDYVERWCIKPPPPYDRISRTGTDDLPAVKRMTDALWWRRGLRVVHARQLERHAINLGYVHKRASSYCSEETLLRRTQQRQRNTQALEATLVTNEFGHTFSLAELSSRTVANPEIRRGELMTRIAGFEATAKRLGHVAEFVTVTCPSRFHPRLAASGEENPHHDGSTPKHAAHYLARKWSQLRAKFQRMGLRVYGFRVAEPHHDACPHWHMILFFNPVLSEGVASIARFRAMTRKYFLTDHKHEPGAKARRVTFVRIDMEKGSAAGYIAKYVAKNIDGFRMLDGEDGHSALANAARVEAWASTWGIRQFQQIGGPCVGLWRELRRLKPTPVEHHEPGYWIEAVRVAADSGDWDQYVTTMGGPTALAIHRPVALQYGPEQTTDKETGEITQSVGRYGEPIERAVTGIWEVVTGKILKVLRYVWEFPARLLGRLLTPWTGVNNCTQPHDTTIDASGKNRATIEHRSGCPPDKSDRIQSPGHIFDGVPVLHEGSGHIAETLASI